MLRAVDDKLITHLIKAIEAEVIQKRAELAQGAFLHEKGATADRVATQYAYRVGYLKGIDDMVGLLEKVAQEVEKL